VQDRAPGGRNPARSPGSRGDHIPPPEVVMICCR
jgi:hypothetical protein